MTFISFCWGFLMSMFTLSPETELPDIKTTVPVEGVYMVKVNNAPEYDIEPLVTNELTEAGRVYDSAYMKVLVNAGFFDPKTGQTASYVVLNKKIVLDPHDNKSLMTNSALEPYMDRILNRGEFRVLNCKGKPAYDIAYHNDKTDEQCEIIHSVQAGPILDDRMDLEKEYFVVEKDGVVVRDSISALKRVARTAIGIKSNDIYLFVVTDKNPMTIQELGDFMKSQGMEKALAFDGGSSTSFENGNLSITSVGDGMGRKVKSFLVVKRR